MDPKTFQQDLLKYLQESPSPFHATQAMTSLLLAKGFTELQESDSWDLKPGGSYFLTRNQSSLMAFRLASQQPENQGWLMAGAHTDSPCLKIKPQGHQVKQGYLQLGVEIYGGALLAPWFDRDLSIAGRVHYRDSTGKLKDCLLDFHRPIAYIPSLAIHLFREVHENRTINPQTELTPVLLKIEEGKDQKDFSIMLREEIRDQGLDDKADKVLAFDLVCYDTQAPTLVGYKKEWIASARLDNLLSCFVILQSLLQAKNQANAMIICNDHEEVGSQSEVGASGPWLKRNLERIHGSPEKLNGALSGSFLVSCDNAHGIHPNYSDKHDPKHQPMINAGPVIKVNANQRYATNSETAARFIAICEDLDLPHQFFVSRNDIPCGSTIGPLTASRLGIPTLDVGLATWAMHSIRELGGTEDAWSLFQILRENFSRPSAK